MCLAGCWEARDPVGPVKYRQIIIASTMTFSAIFPERKGVRETCAFEGLVDGELESCECVGAGYGRHFLQVKGLGAITCI